jgi:hypothetical protein
MIDRGGFAAGAASHAPTSPIDLAPTILGHLQLPAEGMDGGACKVRTLLADPPWQFQNKTGRLNTNFAGPA